MKLMDEFEKIIEYINIEKLGKIYLNKSFSDVTSLKVGGKIRLVFLPKTIKKFLYFYDFYYKNYSNIPLVVLGNGTNILASDDIFLGIVVMFKNINISYYEIDGYVYCFPQCKMNYLAKTLIEKGYSGIEYFGGIPGTIGGLVNMNASFLNKSIGEYVEEVVVLTRDNKIKTYKKEELNFGYRSSKIKENNDIILLVKLGFLKEDPLDIKKRYKSLQKIRKETQPLNVLSAGCAFKNPSNYKAWKVIKDLGYEGKKHGGAEVNKKHCNFIVNTGKASSSDLYLLTKEIKEKALEKYNINLENEWILINF